MTVTQPLLPGWDIAAEIAELRALMRQLTAALVTVAVLALVFTAVNVTRFAVAHGVPTPIAWLLDPMVALGLAAGLLTDAKLAVHRARPPAWGAVLRWYTGVSTLTMNTWTSWWPDGHVGVPRDPDVAGIILHSIPPILVMILAEAVAAYRRRINSLIAHRAAIPQAPPPFPSYPATVDPGFPTPAREADPQEDALASAPQTPDEVPDASGAPRDGYPEQLYTAAWRVDQRSRTLNEKPASVRLLRRQLRIKQDTAVHLAAWLRDFGPDGIGPDAGDLRR
ncbi:hypothetical protein [Embleya sp. NBC_00896]|uniref:hypothetical protein n=1 Tax=Embleya sp. NBC_00896 TaxID=2975961 RepID=UPI002F91AB6B|nr:hypothetical protein OG928_48455 [Embleya sp. NBC_00896]